MINIPAALYISLLLIQNIEFSKKGKNVVFFDIIFKITPKITLIYNYALFYDFIFQKLTEINSSEKNMENPKVVNDVFFNCSLNLAPSR